ncbi:MAG: tol-pal system-associated acyl-CoA thioesterase [Gammaproteobacteria bacterium]|nr:tol-pal system-associated acyl-CoA thioesterase [Gammaproteobacteria bacterium]
MNEFVWPVRVYYEDTDSGGVVYYANYLKFMERARTEWLRSLGVEQDDLAARVNALFVVRSADMEFLHPGRFNDLLQVRSRVAQRGRASLVFEQRIVRAGDELLCAGRIKIACLDASTWRPRAIPAEVLKKMAVEEITRSED